MIMKIKANPAAWMTANFVILFSSFITPAFAQGTAFTYQGRLNAGGTAATGLYDFRFKVYVDALGNTQVGGSIVTNGLGVTNGLFTTTLDFGPGILTGASLWLEVDVKTNNAGSYAVLTPLQALTPTPYAITAANVSGTIASANLAGAYGNAVTLGNPANQINGAFTGNGANVTNVNAATLAGLNATNFWQVGGNSGANPTNGAFLGTADNLPLEVRVNGSPALRLAYSYDGIDGSESPNIIGGYRDNVVSNGVSGAYIGGGGLAGYLNRVGGIYGAVLGGAGNTASGITSVAMGQTTTASGNSATAMGQTTTASGDYSTAMGQGTYASGNAAIAMGYQATAAGDFSTAMGLSSSASNYCSTAMGYAAQAIHDGTFVWADGSGNNFSSTTNNEFSVRAQNGVHIQADKGIHLTAGDEPLIVRDWDVFATNAPSQKTGIGRWGLFMEPYTLTLGIPGNDIAGRFFQVAKYSTNGTPTMLLQVDQYGNLTNAGSIYSAGNVYAHGVLLTSDRNAKENFQPLDAQTVLAKVAGLPVTEWNYKSDSEVQKHIGPMAQDFQAAFQLSADDKHISVVDEGGVALVAIQGLNEKVENDQRTAEAQLKNLATENAELKARLEKLEQLLAQKLK